MGKIGHVGHDAGILAAAHRALVPNEPVVMVDQKPTGKETNRSGTWIPFAAVNFDDKSMNTFHLDTRDFFMSRSSLRKELELVKTRKYPYKYFHTSEELKALLNRLFTESGGPVGWRCLELTNVFRTQNWEMKYIRIVRTSDGFIVCNDSYFVFNKHDLAQPVSKAHLNAH